MAGEYRACTGQAQSRQTEPGVSAARSVGVLGEGLVRRHQYDVDGSRTPLRRGLLLAHKTCCFLLVTLASVHNLAAQKQHLDGKVRERAPFPANRCKCLVSTRGLLIKMLSGLYIMSQLQVIHSCKKLRNHFPEAHRAFLNG